MSTVNYPLQKDSCQNENLSSIGKKRQKNGLANDRLSTNPILKTLRWAMPSFDGIAFFILYYFPKKLVENGLLQEVNNTKLVAFEKCQTWEA